MPQLNAFALETPPPPGRPSRVQLDAPLAAGAVELPARTPIAPEPFVAHFSASSFQRPSAFEPSRFVHDDEAALRKAVAPLIPFCGGIAAGGGGALIDTSGGAAGGGARLCLTMAKAVYVQMRRMFEETILGASPPSEPYGYPIHTVGERVEVLVKPRMYYELQRGVKKLRF